MLTNLKKVIVFDLDGTLVDSMNDFAVVASHVIHEHYHIDKDKALKMYLDTSGLPFEFQLQALFPNDNRNKQAVADFEQKKLEGYFTKPFYDDVMSVLPLLKDKGIKLSVSSNNYTDNVIKKMEPVQHLFDLILGYGQGLSKGKFHFDYIRKHFNVDINEILFVGDSLNDARCAKDNQIDFMARLGTFTQQDFDSLGFYVKTLESYDALKEMMCS